MALEIMETPYQPSDNWFVEKGWVKLDEDNIGPYFGPNDYEAVWSPPGSKNTNRFTNSINLVALDSEPRSIIAYPDKVSFMRLKSEAEDLELLDQSDDGSFKFYRLKGQWLLALYQGGDGSTTFIFPDQEITNYKKSLIASK